MKLTSFVTSLLLGLSHPSTTAAIDRVVLPGQSIAAKIQDAHASGNFKPRLTLNAKRADSNRTNYVVRVREATPAVTSMTTVSIQNGTSIPVNEDDVATMLVSNEDGVIALISVDKKGGKVDGFVQKNGENTKFTQRGGGGKALATIADKFEPPAWSCGSTHYSTERRSLSHGDHEENHRHSHHDHSDHDFDPSNIQDGISDLRHSLRGSELHLGKRRRVQGASYAHWVDVYVEIDHALCNANGETCATGIGPKTLNYVNALFTGANTIYEIEIDTHLNVLHINLNTNYNSMTDTCEALGAMQARFGSTTGWHYTSPSGIKPDVHHALLGKEMNGGCAYVGDVICNPFWGFGVNGYLSGNFVSMDNAVVWDMMVFMHELGHNFGTSHTHDSYSPQVDTCGVSFPGSCSSQLPLAKSATIMSYCYLCNGGLENIAHTFGGKYKGTGSRSDPNSYNNSPLAGTVSFESRQVNAKMWTSVSSRGACTKPPGTTPPPFDGPFANKYLSGYASGTFSSYATEIDAKWACVANVDCQGITKESTTSYTLRKNSQLLDSTAGEVSWLKISLPTTTSKPTTRKPSTQPTTPRPTTSGSAKPTTRRPTTSGSAKPTTRRPTFKPTQMPTNEPTTNEPTTDSPTTDSPTTDSPTSVSPTTNSPSSGSPTTESPTTDQPTSKPTTRKPTTRKPTTRKPTTRKPTTRKPALF